MYNTYIPQFHVLFILNIINYEITKACSNFPETYKVSYCCDFSPFFFYNTYTEETKNFYFQPQGA